MNKKKSKCDFISLRILCKQQNQQKKRKVVSKQAEQILVYVLRFYFRFLYFLPILLLTVVWLVPVIVSFKYTLLLLLLLYLTKKSVCCQKHTQVMSPLLFISSLSVSLSIASAASGQKQAEATSHTLHAGAAERTGALLQQDALSGYLYARGDRHADRPHRVTCAGESTHQVNQLPVSSSSSLLLLPVCVRCQTLRGFVAVAASLISMQLATCHLPPTSLPATANCHLSFSVAT